MIIDGAPATGSTCCDDCNDSASPNLIYDIQNVGIGAGLFKEKVGITAYFKKLVAGDNISLVESADTITINSTGGGSSDLTHVEFDPYSASTLSNINSRLLKSTFNSYTGTTLPNTYLTKSDFNSYSGLTNSSIASKLPTSSFNIYSGVTFTSINSRVLKTVFNSYTGSTAPATYQSKSSIITLTGTTLPLTYQSKSSIVTLTGSTLPATYQSKSSIVTLTGTTLPATYLPKSAFNIYSGLTATAIGLKKNIANNTPTTVTTSGSLTINGVSGSLITLDCSNREESKFSFSGNTTPLSIALDNFPEGAYAILTIVRSTNVNVSVRFKNKTYLLSNTQLINNGKDALIVRGRSSGKTIATFGFYSAGEVGAQDNQSSPSTTNLVNQLKFVEDTSL